MKRVQYRIARSERSLAGLIVVGFGAALVAAGLIGPGAGLWLMAGVVLLLAGLCLHMAVDRAHAGQEAREWEQHIAQQLHEDPETSLGTRRQLDLAWIKSNARARRWGEPFCIVVLEVHDAFGVQDRPLSAETARQVGVVLTEAARGEDSVFRLGNSAFAVLLAAAGATGAAAFVERVRIRISSDPLPGGAGAFFTVYGGLCEWHEDYPTAEAMLRAADSDLRRYGSELRRQSEAWGGAAAW